MLSPSDRLPASSAKSSVPLLMLSRPSQSRIPSYIGSVEPAARASDRGAGFYQGLFASMKNARSIPWKTYANRDLMCLLEVDASVRSYEASPEQVSFVLDGKTRQHVPSFRVKLWRGTVVLDAFAGNGGSGRTANALKEIYADRGVPYRALLSRDIRLQPRFGNARWVLARRGYQTSDREELLIVGALTMQDRLTIADLQAVLPNVENIVSAVCSMVVHGHLSLDLSAPAAMDMTVSLDVGSAR